MFLYNVLQLFFVHSAMIVSINQVTNRPTLPLYADIAGNKYHSERHSDNPGSIYRLGLKRQGITRELSRLRRKKDLYKSGTVRGF